MKRLFFLLCLALAAIYVLRASQALEFKKRTFEKKETIERVGFMPVFHTDRLIEYFENQWNQVKKLFGAASGNVSGIVH